MISTQQDIVLAQLYEALGQGTGCLRVSRKAGTALGGRYLPLVTEEVAARWEALAPQVLERIRTIGRLAAQMTAAQGATSIAPEVVRQAAVLVEERSDTPICPPSPRTWVGTERGWTPAEDILAQMHVAFGQGAGALGVMTEATAALQERYRVIVGADLVGRWEEAGGQLLERVRAVGRLAAHRASEAGHDRISRAVFLGATLTVEAASDCPHCPGRWSPPAPQPLRG
jgi:hypothetical protein